MKAEPRDSISPPLMQPEPWPFFQRSTGRWIVVRTRTWFEARERAPIAFAERHGGCPPDDLRLECNPVHEAERCRAIAQQLEAKPVRIVLRADCTEVQRVLSLAEVREALEEGRRAAGVPLGGLKVNGAAPKWAPGMGFEVRDVTPDQPGQATHKK